MLKTVRTTQQSLCLTVSGSVPSRVTWKSARVGSPRPGGHCLAGPPCPCLPPPPEVAALGASLDTNSGKCFSQRPECP